MPGLIDWRPYETHVQGGLREGNFLNGQFILVCAGPPHLADVGVGLPAPGASSESDVVYPIGLTQNIALSQNKSISRIFEIGSERSYFISGRTVGQLTLSRVVYHGPSLLRTLYAYYGTGKPFDIGKKIDPLFQSGGAENPLNFPFVDTLGNQGGNVQEAATNHRGGLHDVQVPPGYDNLFLNLASDLFSQPIGLLLVFKDNAENNVAHVYLEQAYVPTHTLAVDSQGLIVQESVGIQYERLVPVPTSSVQLLNTVLDDIQGGSSY